MERRHYFIPLRFFDTCEDLLNKTCIKIKNCPDESSINWKWKGLVYKKNLGGEYVTCRELLFEYDIKANQNEFIGILSINVNNFYALKTLTDRKIDCPYYWIKKPLLCEHCKVATNRKYSYIFKDSRDSKMMQIGYECLNDFSDSLIETSIKLVEKLVQHLKAYESSYNSIVGDKTIPVKLIYRTVILIVDKHGYVKNTEGDKLSTKKLVYDILMKSPQAAEKIIKELNIVSPFTICSEPIEEKINRILKYYREINYLDNEYLTSVRTVTMKETAEFSQIGLIASSYIGYLNYMKKQKA